VEEETVIFLINKTLAQMLIIFSPKNLLFKEIYSILLIFLINKRNFLFLLLLIIKIIIKIKEIKEIKKIIKIKNHLLKDLVIGFVIIARI
jgi:hypothetical protein